MQRTALPDSQQPGVSNYAAKTNTPRAGSVQLHSLESDVCTGTSRMRSFQDRGPEPLRQTSENGVSKPLQHASCGTPVDSSWLFQPTFQDLDDRVEGSQSFDQTSGVRSDSESAQGGEDVCGLGRPHERLVPLGGSRQPGRLCLAFGNQSTGQRGGEGSCEGSGSVEKSSVECRQSVKHASGSPFEKTGYSESSPHEPLDRQALRGVQQLDQILRERVEAIFQDGDGGQNWGGAEHTFRSIPCGGARSGGSHSSALQAEPAGGPPSSDLHACQTSISVSTARHYSWGAFEAMPEPADGHHSRRIQVCRDSNEVSRTQGCYSFGSTCFKTNADNPGSDEGVVLQVNPPSIWRGRSGHSAGPGQTQPHDNSGTPERQINTPAESFSSKDWDCPGNCCGPPVEICRIPHVSGLSGYDDGARCFNSLASAAVYEPCVPVQTSNRAPDRSGVQPDSDRSAAKWLRLTTLPKPLQTVLRKVSNLENYNEVWESLNRFTEKRRRKNLDFEKVVELIHSKCIETSFLKSTIVESVGVF